MTETGVNHNGALDTALVLIDIAADADAFATIKGVRVQKDFPEPFADIVSFLHCTSAYPTPADQLYLRAM